MPLLKPLTWASIELIVAFSYTSRYLPLVKHLVALPVRPLEVSLLFVWG